MYAKTNIQAYKQIYKQTYKQTIKQTNERGPFPRERLGMVSPLTCRSPDVQSFVGAGRVPLCCGWWNWFSCILSTRFERMFPIRFLNDLVYLHAI